MSCKGTSSVACRCPTWPASGVILERGGDEQVSLGTCIYTVRLGCLLCCFVYCRLWSRFWPLSCEIDVRRRGRRRRRKACDANALRRFVHMGMLDVCCERRVRQFDVFLKEKDNRFRFLRRLPPDIFCYVLSQFHYKHYLVFFPLKSVSVCLCCLTEGQMPTAAVPTISCELPRQTLRARAGGLSTTSPKALSQASCFSGAACVSYHQLCLVSFK
ncbi:hypothetical protein V8C44DRAFT_172751 [Trichoderma aethiopicum]